jgi:hypothetical protein
MMCPAIDNPPSYKICAAEIYNELCTIYGQNVMSEETVRQWCRMFKDGRTNVHDEEGSGWPSVVSNDLFQSERQLFTISETLCGFPQISLSVLYEIITVRLGCHKFCARWVQKILTYVHKMQRMALALIFLECYHKDGHEFLNHIIRVTGDETWVSFVNVETKEQSKWMLTRSPNKLKKFKQTFYARKLMESVFWYRK